MWPLCLLLFSAIPEPRVAAPEPRQLFADGVTAFENGDPAKARDLLSAVTKAAPDWDLAFLELGLAEEKLSESDPNHLEPARVAFERAVALAPDNSRANFELAVCYQLQKRYHDAVPLLQRAVQLRPHWYDAALRLGEVQLQDNDVAGAIATYTNLTKFASALVAAQTRLADLYESRQQLDLAEEALVNIVHAQPQVPYFHYQLAEFYQRNGMPRKAQEEFGRAALLDPRQPQRKMRKLRRSPR